jgi:hypothetical protein
MARKKKEFRPYVRFFVENPEDIEHPIPLNSMTRKEVREMCRHSIERLCAMQGIKIKEIEFEPDEAENELYTDLKDGYYTLRRDRGNARST